jgi:hypothetical protein
MALRPTQPLTEMSTRNIPEGKERPAPYAADKLTAVCEPTVYKMWESRPVDLHSLLYGYVYFFTFC